MRVDKDDKQAARPQVPSEALEHEYLTDMIDELARSAFRRALERRHAAPSYRTVIESANLVPTRSA